ncbi:MAG TPA: hypothetical protein VM450_18810 [Thermomicrobiales bacterium]|nr:hypothetical protein [Thermomicrobiales bacterium]
MNTSATTSFEPYEEPPPPRPAANAAPPSAPGLQQEIIRFRAGDGFACNLIRITGPTPPTRGPVLLVHGAGVRANIFQAPVKTTIVDALVERGYDVWLENWRASIDLPPTRWTLDQAAVYDHPKAVETIVARTGASEVKAIIHCQGSTSFMMSAWAGLVPNVSTIVSNAVSMHPVVPRLSLMKLRLPMPIVARFTDYLNPRWGLYAPTMTAKVIAAFIEATHHECDNPVCHGVSFTYGSGFPALWRHEQLNDETHEWLKREFAHVPISFFRQIARSIRHGTLVPVEHHPELPADFATSAPRTDARFAFFAGERNRCFLPESQERTVAHLDHLHPGRHSMHLIPDYSHLDIFMGKNAARDVFPLMLAELER